MKQGKKNAIIGLTIFILYIALDFLIDDQLYQLTYTTYFYTIQFREISNQIRTWVLLLCKIIFLYMYMTFNKKLDVLLLLLFNFFLCATHAFLKEIYNQGRPFMLNPEIQTIECIAELGKPSGHTIYIISYMISFYKADFFENQEAMKLPILKAILYTIIAIIVAFSRIVLGVHSIGQVLYGAVFTICMYIIYLNYLHSKLNKLFHKYIKRPNHVLTFVTAALFCLFLFMCLGADLYSREYFAKHSDKYYQYLDAVQNCRKEQGLEPIEGEFILQRSTVESYSYYFIIIGVLLGLVIFRGNYEEGLYETQTKLRTRFTLFIRLLIFYALIFLTKISLEKLEPQEHIKFLLLIVVGYIFMGLILSLIYPLLMFCLGLEIYGSMQCVNKSTLFTDYSNIWETESMISF